MMDIPSIILILVIAVLAALYVSTPFNKPAKPADGNGKTSTSKLAQQPERLTSALEMERNRLMDALRDLDQDYTMGKVPEDDYGAQRDMLLKAIVDILRRLDNSGQD
jgi:hypothetical protein